MNNPTLMTTTTLANFDIVGILFFLFVIWFFGLILYLRREDRREGYPLEEDTTGRLENIEGLLWFAKPKKFRLADGTIIAKPDLKRETRPLALKRLAVWPGAPSKPTGDPMVDGVGPGSYAERANVADTDLHGNPRIAPLAALAGFKILTRDPDPRGMTILGADGKQAGVVTEVWVDRMESMIRYLQVRVDGDAAIGPLLVPFTMTTIDRRKGVVRCDAASAHQFAGAPRPVSVGQLTRYEEERIVAYFGGGYLYANPRRAEPLI